MDSPCQQPARSAPWVADPVTTAEPSHMTYWTESIAFTVLPPILRYFVLLLTSAQSCVKAASEAVSSAVLIVGTIVDMP